MLQEPTVVHSEPANGSTTHVVHALMHFLVALRYRKNVVFTALIVAGLLGALYYGTATPYYKASASIMVMGSGVDGEALTMDPAGGARRNLMPTLQKLLGKDKVLLGALEYLRPADCIDFAGAPREGWVGILKRNLSAQADRGANIIEISYQSKDPKAAVDVLNAVVQSYIAFLDSTHKGSALEVSRLLFKEKSETEERLARKQQELQDAQYRRRDIGLRSDSDGLHPVVKKVLTLGEALTEAQQKRMNLDASLGALESAIRKGENLQTHAFALADVVGRELLLSRLGINQQDARFQIDTERRLVEARAELKTKMDGGLGRNHWEIIQIQNRIQENQRYLLEYQNRIQTRLAEIESSELAPMLENIVQQKLCESGLHEAMLKASYEQARDAAVQHTAQFSELEKIRRDVVQLQNEQVRLSDKLADIELTHDVQEIRPTVVQEPVEAANPFIPNLRRVMMVALLGGLAAGIALVYVLDILDDRFRSVEEMQAQLDVPVLAMVRQLEISETNGVDALQMHRSPNSAECEAFRTLRTALALADREARRIVISSAEPGDGKTTVLANLAVSYAQSSKRTLLIDADLRRPGMTALMGMRGIDGLSGVIRGDGNVVEMATALIRPSGIEGLDVLASGPRPANPAELLADPRFSELLAWAETVYDQVFIDSPPALATSDTAVIGRLVDGVVIVVQPDKNRRRSVMRATDSLVKLNIPLLGIVVNRIGCDDDRGYYGYGYGYSNGYGYSDGYGSDGEAEDLGAEDLGAEDLGAEAGNEQHATEIHAGDRLEYQAVDTGDTVVPRRVA